MTQPKETVDTSPQKTPNEDTPDRDSKPTESLETYLENLERFEYDLPLVTDEDRRERLREEMWDKYSYDIDK